MLTRANSHFSLTRRKLLLASSAAPLSLSACGDFMKDAPPPSTSNQWNATMIDGVREAKQGPPMVSRAMAIANTAAFDAWAPYHSKAVATQAGGSERISGSANTEQAKSISISYAMYRTLVDLMPTQKARFDAKMAELGLDINDNARDGSPAGVGNTAAALVLAYRATDGSNQQGTLAPGAFADYTGYAPVNTTTSVNDPNRWQPQVFVSASGNTSPGFMAPHWGNVKPFSIADGAALRVATTLPTYGSAAYKEQADYVVELTGNLDDKQKAIAEYWANGPKTELPPGHWNLFAQEIGYRRENSLDQDVVMFFLQGNAVMDAGIVCWDCKRFYDYVRPITAVRVLNTGKQIKGFISASQGIGLMAGESWSPWQPASFITPPFAEFTSGHSTFSAASAEVLKRFFGSDVFGYSAIFQASSFSTEQTSPKSTVELSWNTFSEAVDEAGMSRLYGGIHFEQANTTGKAMGRQVGTAVWDKTQALLNGTRS